MSEKEVRVEEMGESSDHSIVIDQAVEQPDTAVEQLAVTGTSRVEKNVTTEDEEKLEAERQELEKTVKERGVVLLGVIVTLLAAAIETNNRPRSRSRGEIILLGSGVGFALVSFLVWAALLILTHLRKMKTPILRGSIAISIFSLAVGVLLIGMSVWM